LPQTPYDIVVGSGSLDHLETHLERAGLSGPFLVVSQPRIYKAVGKRLGKRFPVELIPEGERAKTLGTVSRLLQRFSDVQMTRQSTVIALGGGVVGDVTGFAASMYMRGIGVVQVPTTLLAQVDSSIGGKTGVNFRNIKNLVGAFHQPRLVLADTATLATLPDREFRSGLYESLKYGILGDRELFDYFDSYLKSILQRNPVALETLVARCASIKADVVSRDEREGDLRRILNLGHTIGHGLETAAGFRKLKHGEAVGYGMIAAARISESMNRLTAHDEQRIESTIHAIGPLPPLHSLNLRTILDAIQHDKKVRDGAVHFVLPVRIGQVEITRQVPLELVRDTVKNLLHETKARRTR
jgi:3-dehydroquinate synthase